MPTNKKQQELMFKLTMFEQQIKQLQEQLQAVEQAVLEVSTLNAGLEDIKAGKGIMASVGKGIFVKAKLISEDLIVDVGDKNFVKKNIPETQKLIKTQIKKLGEVKQELETRLEEVNHEVMQVINDAQEEK